MKHKLLLFRLWLLRKLGYQPEYLRQNTPKHVGRIYEQFGYILAIMPHTPQDKLAIKRQAPDFDEQLDKDAIDETSCCVCALHQLGLPCPPSVFLNTGEELCDNHKFVCLKKPNDR